MIPLQEIDFHTDKKVFYKVHLVKPEGTTTFSAEVIVYDSEYQPPFSSVVSFHQQFQNSEAAFAHALSWLKAHASKHSYSVNRINNPCNCEFLSKEKQQTEISKVGLNVTVQVNGA